ncbi:MAG: helicase-related protein [Paludibacteraceae bacterium]
MIKTKRDSLENFIRSQMLGPGACNNRFGFIQEDESNDIIEIINTTPGSLYSTGVLFPKRKVKHTSNSNSEILQENVEDDKIDIEEDEESDNENDVDFEDKHPTLTQSDEDDLYSLSQRFPNTFGMSFCVNSQNISDITLTISGRYYYKILKDERQKIKVIINENHADFSVFYSLYEKQLNPYFKLKENYLTAAKDFSKDYAEVKKTILDINLSITESIARQTDGSLDILFVGSIESKYRYLKSYKEKLWNILKSLKGHGEYISEEDKITILNKISLIEKYETYLSYLEDVLSIYNSKSFGFWKGVLFSKQIPLNQITCNPDINKEIFKPAKYPSFKNIVSFKVADNVESTLSVWMEIAKDSRDLNSCKRYIKVQVENSSTEFEEDNKHYFSIVTEKVNERCFFGMEIKVDSKDLLPYRTNSKTIDTSDEADQLNYLYRSIEDYGVGHFCSVDWTTTNEIKSIKSEFIPSYETPDVEPIPRDKNNYVEDNEVFSPKPLLADTKALEFKWLSTLSDASDKEIILKLYEFVDAYGVWIENLKSTCDKTSQFAIHNIENCRKDYNRMRENIQLLLEDNQKNIKSFRLMNTAMFIQLWHSKNTIPAGKKINQDFYKDANDFIFGKFPATWRPFQIAFILLNLDGVIQRQDDLEWLKRNELVDLVWFPTGGGKTEAYLGIISLTIINRRRIFDKSQHGGTTAIMRYTLRLLATQQFQRAMRVILALEQLRLWDQKDLGVEPITIGLFVGDSSLPNHAKDLLEECRKWNNIKDNKRPESKIPVDKCPWCGELLEFINDKGSESNPVIEFRCKNPRCTFEDSLPVILCDDYIYKNPPTLLFGTVDKFAALAHNVSTLKEEKDSRRIFGKGKNLNNLTPDLIIQDELHLLLGPLGSAVSLFEAAVDQLCTRTDTGIDGKKINIRPKIISSTATTRNTELQIRALYDRCVNIFPKNGIDYDDSFFAFYKRRLENGSPVFIAKRKYLGILPTGRTQMTTQMRLAATMFVHRALFEKENIAILENKDFEKAADFYYSIISYFNSLKEVGKTDAQFYTEFTKYTRRLFKRVLRFSDMLECFYAYDSAFKKSELTGRLTGSEVIDQLEVVSKRWSSAKRLPHKSESGEIWQKGTTPPDYILATNMISVGLDVDRFNTIIMNSMPRNIAEYIQASSRVARNDLGLVITLHNPFRSRDLSHFERFREFHEKLYFYVEPISITPFSKKSINRYLPLYLATMVRHNYNEVAEKSDAGKLDSTLKNKISSELEDYFKERLRRTQLLNESQKELLNSDLEEHINQFIQDAMNEWLVYVNRQTTEKYKLIYSGSQFANDYSRQSTTVSKDLYVALDSYDEERADRLWYVPQSLRTVEAEAVIKIKEEF